MGEKYDILHSHQKGGRSFGYEVVIRIEGGLAKEIIVWGSVHIIGDFMDIFIFFLL